MAVTYETFRDMGLPMVGLVLNLSLGGGAVWFLFNTFDHHGTYPLNHHWCDAGTCLAARTRQPA